jgi:hypothetical protein
MVTKVCPVCDAPENKPCVMCTESHTMFKNMLIPRQQIKPAEMAEVQEKINISSGEDACFA